MLSISVLQINATLGNFEANGKQLLEAAERAKKEGSAFLCAPLGALSGFPVGAFSRRAEFLLDQKKTFEQLAKDLPIPALFGMVPGLVFVQNGQSRLVVNGEVLTVAGKQIGIFTHLEALKESVTDLKLRGAQAAVVVAADPYRRQRPSKRLESAKEAAKKAGIPVLFVNLVGGADQWVFDGASFALNAQGELTHQLVSCAQDFRTMDLASERIDAVPTEDMEELYDALVLALGDYVRKNGFKEVQIGLSGGVDSALTAAIASDALGAENVHALMMPTQFTADLSLSEAKRLAENLGIHYAVRPIGELFEAYRKALAEDFAGKSWDATEENLQARIRGNLLMAHANKFGRLVIATSNKSESAAGYATLYGDTAGAFEAISDVYKTDVWALCRWRNARAGKELIPEAIISRAPSAELREGQKDSQSLPEYAVLDAVLRLYVDEGKSVSEIVRQGFDKELVQRIVRMTHRAEFKRQQCPIGAHVSAVSFSSEAWKYPMTVWLKR